MSFVDGLLAMLGAIESDALAVHEERCISVRNRNAHCLRCAEACTSGAITYRDNDLHVEPDNCIGCGTCATACPTCAIEVRKPTDGELTAAVKRSIVATKGHPVIACETAVRAAESSAESTRGRRGKGSGAPVPDVAQIVEVPCLGRVDESLLAGIAAYRAFDATLVCGACETCQHVPGGKLVREVAASAVSLLAAFGSEMPVTIVDELPQRVLVEDGGAGAAAAGGGVSRRDFLSGAKDATKQAASTAISQELGGQLGEQESVPAACRKVGKDGTLSQFVPSRRVRLYNYLQHVGQPVADEVESRVIGAVSIDTEKCSSCRMCAVFCPTGAIKKLDEGDVFGIVHRPSACMQCRLCERICPEGAITVSGTVPIKQFMGKEAVCFAMEKPTWEPNRPSSMYDKLHMKLGKDLEMCMF